jgi:hypothetical protein
MTDQNPITPPPELVQQWASESLATQHLCTQAARWGADQELEACCEWVSNNCPYFGDFPLPEDKLRAARRPKPPSLKAQALEQLRSLQQCGAGHRDTDKILRALEQLDDN